MGTDALDRIAVALEGILDCLKEPEPKPRKRRVVKKTTHKDPHAEAFKAAFDEQFPEPYVWQDGDFVQLTRWRKAYEDVTPERFVEVAQGQWARGEYRSKASLTIRGLCSRWAQLAADVGDADTFKPNHAPLSAEEREALWG